MATWQFTISLIPKPWAIENQFNSSSLYDDEGYDTEIAWETNQPNPEFINLLSELLPPSKSWSNDLLFWGNEKEHDIKVGIENKLIEGIHIRLDLNKKLNTLIEKLIQIAKELDCVLFFPELEIVTEANKFELKKALQNSRAASFVKDPSRFLSEL